MFGIFKKKLSENVNQFSGRTDFLQGACAIAALVASSDGDISDSEITKATTSINALDAITKNFDQRVIDTTLDQMLTKAGSGRVGRNQLWKEVEECAKEHEIGESVLLIGLDVADDGGIGDKEMIVLQDAAKRLGLNLQSYL